MPASLKGCGPSLSRSWWQQTKTMLTRRGNSTQILASTSNSCARELWLSEISSHIFGIDKTQILIEIYGVDTRHSEKMVLDCNKKNRWRLDVGRTPSSTASRPPFSQYKFLYPTLYICSQAANDLEFMFVLEPPHVEMTSYSFSVAPMCHAGLGHHNLAFIIIMNTSNVSHDQNLPKTFLTSNNDFRTLWYRRNNIRHESSAEPQH